MTKLPSGWAEAPLDDVCEILDFKRIPINSKERKQRIEGKSSHELFPYYGATGQVDVIDGYLFKGQHVLIGEDGAPFLDPIKPKAYMVDGRFWVNNHAHILRALGDNRYLCHYLNFIRYEDHVTGTTRLKLTKSALVAIPILVPPLNEQRRIVEKIEAMFDEIDKGVESLHTARTTLGLYRQSLLKSAFEGRLTADWRALNADKLEAPETLLARIQRERDTRYKAALDAWQDALTTWRADGEQGKKPAKPKRPDTLSAPTDVELDRVPKLPDEWAIAQVNELSEHITSGSRDWKTHYGRGSSVFVMAQNVRAGRYDPGTKQIIDPPTDSMSAERTRVVKNDLLITIVGANTGNVCVFPFEREDHYVCQSVALVRLYNPALARYLNFYFQDEFSGKKILDYYIYGAGRPHLGFEDLKRTLVPICSPAEQTEIVRRLDARLEAAEALEAEIDAALTRADALRQSILKKAFSGQLVPQDPNDEPASALLERIKAERAKAPKKTRKKAPA